MLSKKDIEELATGAVKRYFNTCNLISPQIQENDKTPDWDGELNLYETKKDIRKNYIGSLRIQVKGKEVSKFKTKETFPIETIFLRNAKNEGFVFFVVEVMPNGDNKIFYKKMAPIEIRGLLATINKQQKTRSMPFEPLSMDKSWTEAELKAFLSDCIKQKSFASKNPFSIEDVKNVHDMNALWNQNYGANIRILLLNNEGGEIFHTLPGMDKSSRSREFITAEHYTTAKGWAEERGFIYMKVTGEEELEEAMQPFTSPETRMQPMLLEVFTDKEKDTTLLREYYHGLKNKNE